MFVGNNHNLYDLEFFKLLNLHKIRREILLKTKLTFSGMEEEDIASRSVDSGATILGYDSLFQVSHNTMISNNRLCRS